MLLTCPDRSGIVAAVSTFLTRAGANIISLDQHSTQPEGGTFLQRTVFHLPGLTAASPELDREFAELAAQFEIEYRFTEAAKPKRVAIFASTADHCLLDLLWRNQGELDMTVVMVIANHPELAEQVRAFNVPFVYIPATRDTRAEGAAAAGTAARQCRSGGARALYADRHAGIPGHFVKLCLDYCTLLSCQGLL